MDDRPPKISTARQRVYLAKAARVALRSTMTHKHGCVIVHSDGTILYDGYNHHDLQLNHKFSIHAEIDALYKAKRQKQRLTDCEMYVVRIGSHRINAGLKYSKPCPGCATEIEKCGIRKVYYSVNDKE
jgi:tRNA(Arg) A34 adenosine deaminase TadA